MTILGAIADRDTAVIWADTLLTNSRTGLATGEVCKLAVNGLAGAVGAGRGWGELASDADVALLAARTLDEAVPDVSRILRQSAGRLAPAKERVARYSFMGCGYVIAGWSDEAGRMVVYDLDARSIFEPAIAGACLAPPVEVLASSPPDARAIAGMAFRQAVELYARCGIGVGSLTIATITRQGITVLPPCEIAAPPSVAAADAPPVPPVVGAGTGEAHLTNTLAA